MKVHTTNYIDTLIEIAEDSPVSKSEIPPVKRNKTLANIQIEMVLENPLNILPTKFCLNVLYRKTIFQKAKEKKKEKKPVRNFSRKDRLVFVRLRLRNVTALEFIRILNQRLLFFRWRVQHIKIC